MLSRKSHLVLFKGIPINAVEYEEGEGCLIISCRTEIIFIKFVHT